MEYIIFDTDDMAFLEELALPYLAQIAREVHTSLLKRGGKDTRILNFNCGAHAVSKCIRHPTNTQILLSYDQARCLHDLMNNTVRVRERLLREGEEEGLKLMRILDRYTNCFQRSWKNYAQLLFCIDEKKIKNVHSSYIQNKKGYVHDIIVEINEQIDAKKHKIKYITSNNCFNSGNKCFTAFKSACVIPCNGHFPSTNSCAKLY